MANRFKTIVILAILFISLFAAFIPDTSAKLTIIRLSSNINLTWGEEETQKPVIPRYEVRSLNITIKYSVNWGGDLAHGMFDNYTDKPPGKEIAAYIEVKIIDQSPWCIANLARTTVPTLLKREESESSVILNLQLKDNAPAYGEGYIVIEATVPGMQKIEGISKQFTLNFVAAYLPRISVNLLESNTKQINPTESIVFPIEVENLGNARTRVFFDIENIPEGWTIAVTDDVTLGETEGSKDTAYLTVKPPKDFGYHYDEQSIRVTITPARAENLLDKGEVLYETFLVQSIGFSTPGFEIILFIGAILLVILIIKFRRKNLK